ncbi:MAG TPA: alpha/beta fold hydrolase [Acidimicrobiia bacterium]|nr:alpha/beta fold hydrolase [Acidimicrobiia bacterium]
MAEQMVIHGRELAYRFEGDGPLIVLVHGMAGSASTWDRVVPALAERFAVLALDLPGHGSSAKPIDGDYSLGSFASAVRDLMMTLGLERGTIVGQSLGGGVAMQFAYQFPSRCERLVLVGSGGLGREVSPLLRVLAFPGVEFLYPVIFAPALRNVGRGVLDGFRRIGLRPSAYVDQIWQSYESLTEPETRAAFARTLRSVVDVTGQRVSAHDRLPLAREIPTLIVWGADDAIIPSQHAMDAAATLPHSRVEVFERVGHFPHCEDPDRFVRVLTDFIESTAPALVTDEQFARAVGASATP